MTGKSGFIHLWVLLSLIASITVIPGCKKSDVALVASNSIGNREGASGKVFDHYPGFLNRTWRWETDTLGRHIVVFIGELPVNNLLAASSRDSANWLSIEKRYFKEASGKVKHAYLCIKFLIKPEDSFQIATMNLGIASGSHTAWSPDLKLEEKEKVIDCIYNNSEDLFIILGRYADPSIKNGSTLFHKLTGLDIRKYK